MLMYISLSRSNQRGLSHVIFPMIAIIGVAIVGTVLIHASHAASTPYSGSCTSTIIKTTTVVTTAKYKTCIVEAQELMDAIQREDYKSYHTAIETVPDTFVSGSQHYLTMNSIYSTATAYAVKALPGNGSNNALTNSSTTGSWQLLCSDAVAAGLAVGGKAATYTLTINKNVTGEYNTVTNATTFKAACGSLPSTSTGGGTRSPYTWPFSWNSIWNIPIASTATYAAAGIKSAGSYEDSTSADYDSTNPTFPVVSLQNARLANGSIGAVNVYGDPAMAAGGEWNTCSAFLGTDKTSVYQGQTTELTTGGNPKFGGTADVAWTPVSIEGTGITGCHGGSGLSGLGGTLTLSDLTQSGPITHALKVALDGYVNYSNANGGFRWPAVTADNGYNVPSNANYYGGANPNVVEGSLLALPKSISPTSFTNPTVAKLAEAMQDYGAYIVDNTGTATYDFSTVITNYNSSSRLVSDICTTATPCGYPGSGKSVFSSQLDSLLQDLEVVTNNTVTSPGGGTIGASRCASYAPKFTDGTDTPPAVTVTKC